MSDNQLNTDADADESVLPSATEHDEEEEEEAAEQLITTEEDLTESIRDLPPDFDEDEDADEEDGGAEDDFQDDDDDDEEEDDEIGAFEDFPRKSAGESEGPGPTDSEKGHDKTEEEAAKSEGGESEAESDWIHFLKQPPQSMDDFMDDPDDDMSKHSSTIDIMKLENLTKDEAANIAEFIVQQLEEDLAQYVEKTGVKFPEPMTKAELKRLKYGLTENDSASSFNSELSELLPGEPSRIRMTYEKGVSVYRELSMMHLSHDEMVDKEVQVNLHRSKKHEPVKRFSRYSQTLEMTFMPNETALLIFKQLYPQIDDFKIKEPPSRKASEEMAIHLAQQNDPNIDSKRKGPQIISLSNKKQLLQPLMDDYHKDEKFWTGSRFVGEYRNRQFYKGEYTHPTGAKMESEFDNGHFHSKNHFGVISYPRGDCFEGEWIKGRYQSGQITFCDGLKFASNDWKYCEPPDRRFKVERYYGLKPAGMTLFSDQCPAPSIPAGTYDVGDGYYDPRHGDVRGYDGFLLRQANSSERSWIERNCRKVPETIEQIAPKFLMERIPGSYVESQKRVPLTKKRYH